MEVNIGLLILALVLIGLFLTIFFFLGVGSYFISDRERVVFNLKSDGRSLKDWPNKLFKKHFLLSGAARQIFINSEEQATAQNFGIMILKFKEVNLLAVRDLATTHELLPATIEIAALARNRISEQDMRRMGLDCIIVMHPPVFDHHLFPQLLTINRKRPGLNVTVEKNHEFVRQKVGFLFLLSEPIAMLN